MREWSLVHCFDLVWVVLAFYRQMMLPLAQYLLILNWMMSLELIQLMSYDLVLMRMLWWMMEWELNQ